MSDQQKKILYLMAGFAVLVIECLARIYLEIIRNQSEHVSQAKLLLPITSLFAFFIFIKSMKNPYASEVIRTKIGSFTTVALVFVSVLAYFVIYYPVVSYFTSFGLTARNSEIILLNSSVIIWISIVLIYLAVCLIEEH